MFTWCLVSYLSIYLQSAQTVLYLFSRLSSIVIKEKLCILCVITNQVCWYAQICGYANESGWVSQLVHFFFLHVPTPTKSQNGLFSQSTLHSFPPQALTRLLNSTKKKKLITKADEINIKESDGARLGLLWCSLTCLSSVLVCERIVNWRKVWF